MLDGLTRIWTDPKRRRRPTWLPNPWCHRYPPVHPHTPSTRLGKSVCFWGITVTASPLLLAIAGQIHSVLSPGYPREEVCNSCGPQPPQCLHQPGQSDPCQWVTAGGGRSALQTGHQHETWLQTSLYQQVRGLEIDVGLLIVTWKRFYHGLW